MRSIPRLMGLILLGVMGCYFAWNVLYPLYMATNLYYATPVVGLSLAGENSLAVKYASAYDLKVESVRIADHNVTIRLKSSISNRFLYDSYDDVIKTRSVWRSLRAYNVHLIPLHVENGSYNVSVYCDGILGAKAELVTGSKLRNIQVNLTTTLR